MSLAAGGRNAMPPSIRVPAPAMQIRGETLSDYADDITRERHILHSNDGGGGHGRPTTVAMGLRLFRSLGNLAKVVKYRAEATV